MTDYNIFVYRVGEDKDDMIIFVYDYILLFTVLERIKMTDYNTFVYRVGEDKDDFCLPCYD